MKRRFVFCFILVALLMSTIPLNTFAQKAKLAFWNMPFVTQEVSPAYVAKWEKDAKTRLPNYIVDNFYGPGKYADQRDKFLVQAKSGKPDVIEGLLEDVAVYVEKGLIEPLDPYFNAWADKNQFDSATIKPLTINGKLWGIPYNNNARGIVYRKDIFKKYNLKVPKTWDEMIATARQITEMTNKKVYGLFMCTLVGDPRAAQEFISWYFQISGKEPMFNVTPSGKSLNATVDQLEKVLSLYGELFTGDYPAADPNEKGTGWPTEDPGYANGRWAMAPMGTWLWGRRSESDIAKDIMENNTTIAPLPVAEGFKQATYLEVKPIMMNKYAKDKKAAWELIKYICSKDKMGEWLADSGGIPARKDSLQMDLFTKSAIGWWIQGFAALIPYSVAQEPINWGPVSRANLQAVNYVIYEEKTPAEAAQWLVDTIKELLETGEI